LDAIAQTNNNALSLIDCLILWKAKKNNCWWVSQTDYLMAGKSTGEAYALFSMLCMKATTGTTTWGRVGKDSRKSILCFHFTETEWEAIKSLLITSKFRGEV